MSKDLFKDLDKYLAQVRDFIQSDRDMTDVFILAHKTENEDKFSIEFNEETIGALALMITENETLSMLAQFGIIHRMALQSEDEIDSHFDKLKELSKSFRRELRGESLQISVKLNTTNLN